MKAVLLCAGYGTRLYPLTENQPKPLLSVGGKPIVEHLLEKIEKLAGVDQVFLVTNDRFYSHFETWTAKKRFPWKLEVVNDGSQTNGTRLGAIGDLHFVLTKFRIRDDIGLFAGDNLFLSELRGFHSFAQFHRPHTSVAVIDVGDRDLARQYGIVQIKKDGEIAAFFEKPEDPPATLASTGGYWFARESLDLLDRYASEGHNADRIGDFIAWLVKVDRVYAYPLEGKWYDIGDLRSYREADRHFREIQTRDSQKKGRN